MRSPKATPLSTPPPAPAGRDPGRPTQRELDDLIGDAPSRTKLLRPSDVARMLSVSRTWLYDAARDGRIPSVRIGGPDGPLRFVPEDLDRWIDAARAGWRPGDSGAAPLRR